MGIVSQPMHGTRPRIWTYAKRDAQAGLLHGSDITLPACHAAAVSPRPCRTSRPVHDVVTIHRGYYLSKAVKCHAGLADPFADMQAYTTRQESPAIIANELASASAAALTDSTPGTSVQGFRVRFLLFTLSQGLLHKDCKVQTYFNSADKLATSSAAALTDSNPGTCVQGFRVRSLDHSHRKHWSEVNMQMS